MTYAYAPLSSADIARLRQPFPTAADLRKIERASREPYPPSRIVRYAGAPVARTLPVA